MTGPANLSETIGGYVLESVLGQGGMGTVYLAKHHLLGRRAAVKVLASELASHEDLVSRFFHEAKVVNDVKHPNIVDVIDFIRTKERVAFVMEFLDGKSLDDKLKVDGPLTAPQAINVILQIASGLSAVHQIGVVHRDLKPANIRFTREDIGDCSYVPILKILDFGIAKAGDSMVGHKTQTGLIMGTPSYMAPEQVAGETVSSAADVYALGELLYELLTGKRLFVGNNSELMRRKLGTVGPEIRLPEGTPDRRRLLHVIESCLAFAPGDRPTDEALIDALTQIREGLITSPATFPPQDRAPINLGSPSTPPPQEAAFAEQTVGPPPISIVERPRRSSVALWAAGASVLVVGAVALFLRSNTETAAPVIVAQPIAEKAPETLVESPPAVPPSTPEVSPVDAATPEKRAPKTAPKKNRRRTPRSDVSPPQDETSKAHGRLKVAAWTTAGRQVPARVLIDGKPVKEAAPFEIDAKAGRRRIEIQAQGQPPKIEEVVVKAGETTKVNVVVDLR